MRSIIILAMLTVTAPAVAQTVVNTQATPPMTIEQQMDLITAEMNRKITGISGYIVQQAARIDEMNKQISDKDAQIKSLGGQVTQLQATIVSKAKGDAAAHGPGKAPAAEPATTAPTEK